MECNHKKENGKQCGSSPMVGSDYCYHHNPKISAKVKKDACRKGGANRKIMISKPLPDLPIVTTTDVVFLLADTICRVRKGQLDIRTANCLGLLGAHILRAMEASDLTEKVDKILEKLESGGLKF